MYSGSATFALHFSAVVGLQWIKTKAPSLGYLSPENINLLTITMHNNGTIDRRSDPGAVLT